MSTTQKPNYTKPLVSDFEENYLCPHCKKTQTNAPPKVLGNGTFLRICPNCAKSQTVHVPPERYDITNSIPTCAGCENCPNYDPAPGTINCSCGCLGSYHYSRMEVVGEGWKEARTRKNALKGDSNYKMVSVSHNDITTNF
ncbi:hypothetical protein ABK040_004329 [Willaertia magna]